MRYLTILFLLSFTIASGQSASKEIDSLMQVAEKANDSTRLRIYNKVSFYYIFNDLPKAQQLLKLGISESQIQNVPFSEAELVNTYGIYYDVSGNSDSAKYYFEKALSLAQDGDFKTITVMIINNLGMFHWNKGEYQEALNYFYQALEMNKKNSLNSGSGNNLNNIGLIYQEMGQNGKALEYHKKALEIRKIHKLPSEIATSLSNIGVVLGSMAEYAESEKYFIQAISIAKDANELGKYYDALNGLSNVYLEQRQPLKAIPLLTELLKGRNENNIDRRSNLITISNLVKANNQSGNLQDALKFIKIGNEFLIEFPIIKNAVVDFYQNASETYFRAHNPIKGAEFLEKSLAVKEQIFSTENAEAIANLETQFKVADSERNLAETRANLAESQLKVDQRNIFIFGIVALTFFVLISGYFFFRQQKLKNSQLEKEAELKSALARIETQNQLQDQRLRISRDLHDNIGSQLAFIISSIDNLKYGIEGTTSMSNKLGEISEFSRQTIYELRDTIWAMNKADISVDDLQARISNFIENAKRASTVNFQFNVENSLSEEIYFNSVQGMNIYRVIQETVNNALKHSEASKIIIQFSLSVKEARIEICDNGNGFDEQSIQFGNGLNNMKKRAKDLMGEIKFLSDPNNGTKVILIVPIVK